MSLENRNRLSHIQETGSGGFLKGDYHLTPKERNVYIAFGKFFQRREAEQAYESWLRDKSNPENTSRLDFEKGHEGLYRTPYAKRYLKGLIDSRLRPDYEVPLLSEEIDMNGKFYSSTDYATNDPRVILTLITKKEGNHDFVTGHLASFSPAALQEYRQALQKSQ